MRAKGAKKTKSGRVFVTCTLSPEGFNKLHELMLARGATSQGAVIEEAIHRWYAEDPLVKDLLSNKNSQNVNPILRELHNRTCQTKENQTREKTGSGKVSENG